jgi:hypothetical protein
MSTILTKEGLHASITRPSTIELPLSPEANNGHHHHHHQVRMNICVYISFDIQLQCRLNFRDPGQL